MAGYSGNSLRAVQKKLRKIVKDVTKSEGFQSILDSVDDSDRNLEFMFEDDTIDQFGDNAQSFKAAADAAWIYCAKIDGLKEHAEQVSLLCTSLLRQEFPDQEFEEVPVTKKRGRASVEKAPSSPVEKTSPRKKAVRKEEPAQSTSKGKKAAVVEEVEEEEAEVTITSADRTALKAILTKLSKDPDAEYFLYPVDADEYPEYFEQIEHPMDLATVKSKINNYSSVGEALADLRAIWDNCRVFNAEGSDILNSAENCSAMLESFVQEKFPGEVLVKKKGRKSKASAEEAPIAPVAVKIEKAVKTEKVDKVDKVEKEETKASAKKAAKRKRATPSHTVVQEGWPVNPRTLVQVPEGLALSRSTMKTLLREVTNSEFAAPFVDPVDFDEAPGYEDLVAMPMDLTTMRKRITAGTYDSDAGLFAKETRLVWENCVLYNDPASEIALFAANLGEAFETQLAAVLEQIAEEEEASAASAAEIEAAALALSTPKNKPGRKPKAVEEDEEDKITVSVPRKVKDNKDGKESSKDKDTATEEEAAEAKKPASVTMKKMKKILREMYKIELSLPFQEPVPVDEVPGYKEMIPTPMDLSTVKAQLSMYEDAPGKFLRDMRLIFDNCQKFNIETSELYKTAGILRDTVDKLYCEAFPPVDAAEELAAAQKAAAKAARKAKLENKDQQDVVMSSNDDYRPRAGSTASNFVMAPVSLTAPVVQVLPTVLPPTSGTSAAALAARLPTKPEELEALEKALSDPSLIPSTNTYVRDRAMLKARDKLKAAKVPYVVAPDLYTVQSFGEIQGTHDKYRDHDEHYLYPLGYCVSRKMRIALLPAHSDEEDGVNLKGRPFVDVDLKCKIGFSYTGNPDIFHVLLENGTAISQGPTAKEAWAAVMGKEQRIMCSLGSKLQRCRAVFNRLAVSPDALPFLEMVPLSGPVGEQYYAIIKSPMWFREVHTRLVEGTYDVEFDFAWDMRLIFKNCMEYNLAGSELYQAAERLGDSFEQLFTRWVLNTQDGTTEDVAKGPWDRWTGLKYFDYEDPTINICAETGTRGPASQMLQCRCCEDQNLATLHPTVSHKNDWACPRCVEALQWSNGDLINSPFCSYINPSTRYDPYSIEEFGGNAFVPAPEFGLGWSQAKRKLPFAGLKNLFLSPLGYEVVKEQIADQAAYEHIVNQNLYAARAVEFQEFAKTTLQPKGGNSKKKTARHRRSTTEPMSPEKGSSAQEGQSSSTVAPATDAAAADEEGRISTGKLYNFVVPEDSKLVWLVCSDETLALEKAAAGQDISAILVERVPLTEALLPESGFFGLHLPVIRARVEGVPGAMNCAEYRFQDEDKHRDDILKEVRNIRKRQELLQASSDTLKKTILEERYRFDRKLLTPPVPTEVEATNAMEHKKDFFPLFPPTVEPSQADVLLCLWEFLYLTPSLAKHIEVYSLHDLVCALAPPTSALATYGQIVFDEVCCSLADLLLGDLRLRCDPPSRSEVKWQDVVMVRPVNIITWPDVAMESLRLLNFPLSMEETRDLLAAPSLPPLQLLQFDLMTLVFNHPLIDTFLVQVAVPEGHTGPDPNVIAAELRKLKDHFGAPDRLLGAPEGIYETAETLCAELRRLFVGIATTDSEAQRLLHSRSIVHWLDGLFVRWGVTVDTSLPEDFPSAESLAPALLAEKLSPWRFWGGFTLSNMELPRAQVLLPSDFNQEVLSDYERRMRALDGLEKTMLLLSRSEPEAWTADQRAAVFLTLIDHGLVTKDSVSAANQRQANVNHKCGRLHDVPTVPPSTVPHFDVVKHSPPGTKCHFTGVEVDHSLEGTVWLSVPLAYQTGPASEAAQVQPAATSNGRGTRGSTVGCVALQSALLNVVSAREVAVRDARFHENRVMTVLQPTLYENAKTCSLQRQLINRVGVDLQRSASYPSQPLGYDRKGNAYWILSVQEASTLFPFHPNGVPLFMAGSVNPGLPEGKMSTEPCVLIREPSGWWGFHNFGEINALLGSFSSELPCERILLLKLIEKAAYTRCLLAKNALNVRVTQREWVVKRIRAEHAVHGVKFPSENLTPLQMNRFLELVWGRCVEVRQYLHINAAYRFEEDGIANSLRAEKDLLLKRSKRLREIVGDDIFQLHHSKGFQRNDFLARLRQTAATTTATQIIADSTFYPMLVENAKKSPFLQRNDPLAPPVPVTRGPLLITGSEEGSAASAAEESKTEGAPAIAAPAAEAMDVEAPVAAASVPAPATDSTVMEVEAEKPSVTAETPASEPMEVVTAPAPATTAPAPAPAHVEDPEAHLIDPSTLLVDLRGFINARFGNTSDNIRTKAIEVVHLVTGELLRVFQSGKDAATFFSVSQSGISLCLHNTKPDYLGYKWRNYDGPPITSWADLDAVQLSYLALVQYQVSKQNRATWDATEERRRVIHAIMQEKKLDPAHFKKTASASRTPTLAYAFNPTPAAAPVHVHVPQVVRQPLPQPVVQAARASFLPNTHIVLSTEVVGARLLRLKAELLNMFYIMPEKTLRLPELDEAGEKAIADAGTEAANNIRNGIAKLSANKSGESPPAAPSATPAPAAAAAPAAENSEKMDEDEDKPAAPFAPTAASGDAANSSALDMSMSNVDRLADKAARKAKRRLRRKLSMEKFVKDVQDATTPQQLLDVTIVLEGAIPQGQMYKYNRASLPHEAATFATLARRVFALDRAIAYDEIRGVENNSAAVPVRLRYQFYPRCIQSASCSKFCGHPGKCVSFNDVGSRIPDFQDLQFNRQPGAQPYQYQAPNAANNRLSNGSNMSAAAQLALANQRKAAYLQQLASLKPKDEDLPLEEILSKLLQVRKELDIETITPYVPPPSAVTQFEWI